MMESGFSSNLAGALAQKASLTGIHGAQDEAALALPEARALHLTLGRAAAGLNSARIEPPSWVKIAIEGLAMKRPHVDGERLSVRLREGRVGYLQAIGTGERCVACHGADAQLKSSVKQWIQTRYPMKKNGAFRLGRLRGWYWIERDTGASPGA